VKEAKQMTMTIFIVFRKMSETVHNEEERQAEVEEISIRDPDSGPSEAPIPVVEASDDEEGDEDEWPERDDGPDHFGWEEVYELNDCSPEYL
jgi:hypothetical protein